MMSAVDGRRNAWKSVAVWAVATVAGIAVCWWGIRPVLDAVVPDRLVAFPTVTQSPAVPGVPPTLPSPVATASPSVGASHSPRAVPRTSGAPVAPPSTGPSTVDGWTGLPDGGYVRTFDLVGGTVTVEASAGTMDLVSATPKTAYVMTVTPTSAGRVQVTFTGLVLHVSTLDARWVSGTPTAKVTEL